MFRLGLTGSIATGKSTALEFFATHAPVYSADAAVHDLYQGAAVAPVAAAFPSVAENGVINRQKLGQVLVEHPEKLAELEAIVHPLVHAKMHQFLAAAEAQNVKLAVLEIPLLFETGTAYPIDAVAVTYCDDAEQRRRALARPGMTVEKLNTILARQMPQAEKVKRADFVIDTGKGLAETQKQIDAIVRACTNS